MGPFCAEWEAGWAAVWAWPGLGIRGLVIFRGQRLSSRILFILLAGGICSHLTQEQTETLRFVSSLPPFPSSLPAPPPRPFLACAAGVMGESSPVALSLEAWV